MLKNLKRRTKYALQMFYRKALRVLLELMESYILQKKHKPFPIMLTLTNYFYMKFQS